LQPLNQFSLFICDSSCNLHPTSFLLQSTKRETNLALAHLSSSVLDFIMSDTKPTTGEASNNPAEAVAQTETAAQASVEKSSDAKPAVADTTTDSTSKDVAAGLQSEEKKDTAEVVKSEESSAKSDEKVVKKEENGNDKKRSYDRKDDRNGKYDRNDRGDHGDKRRGGRNDKFPRNKKPRYEAFLAMTQSFTDLSRNNEFDNLPETDDPVEIRSQVCLPFAMRT
jgi:lupus La protein